MQSRTSEMIATFRKPFSIGSAISDQPAGAYRLVSEEELIEGLSHPAYRLTSTRLQIPAIGTPSMTKQFVNVLRIELDAALEQDQSPHADVSDIPPSMAVGARNFAPSAHADNDNRSL